MINKHITDGERLHRLLGETLYSILMWFYNVGELIYHVISNNISSVLVRYFVLGLVFGIIGAILVAILIGLMKFIRDVVALTVVYLWRIIILMGNKIHYLIWYVCWRIIYLPTKLIRFKKR